MTNALRNSAHVQDTVQKAMRLVLPDVLQKPLQVMLQTCAKQIPDNNTLSRWRLLLDGALSLVHRERNARDEDTGASVRYLLADASLQHGRDFEHMMVTTISRARLPELFNASA
eukprot:4846318-Amphidinium_carterae.1